ncbi:MAG: sigma-70 family RNA polymerase sigma factor [Acidobacteriota bacterium]|nr:sigma-70 family RNA polymerase sigma factor [Acidobacteriota bacterium]MDE3139804.1 sigma-70 family RNA polymerase sigma factor [Acidobacteriota bacterium]
MDQLDEAGDAQLVTMIGRYHEGALAEVYRRHGGAVYGLARKILVNSAEADDVTQDVFLRLWNHPDRFDPSRGSLRSFLLNDSHGRAVDLIRSLNSRRAREEREAHRSPVGVYDLQHRVWDLAVAEEVQRALTSLPPEEREAIELAYFQGHSYVKVAEILGQPEGTIKSRIRNGMRRMRSTLVAVGVQGAE